MSLTKLFLEELHRTEEAQDSGVALEDVEGETVPEILARDLGYFAYVFTHPLKSTKTYFSRILDG